MVTNPTGHGPPVIVSVTMVYIPNMFDITIKNSTYIIEISDSVVGAGHHRRVIHQSV